MCSFIFGVFGGIFWCVVSLLFLIVFGMVVCWWSVSRVFVYWLIGYVFMVRLMILRSSLVSMGLLW